MTSTSKVHWSTESDHVIREDFPIALYRVPSTKYSIGDNNNPNNQRYIVVKDTIHEILLKDNKLLSNYKCLELTTDFFVLTFHSSLNN